MCNICNFGKIVLYSKSKVKNFYIKKCSTNLEMSGFVLNNKSLFFPFLSIITYFKSPP